MLISRLRHALEVVHFIEWGFDDKCSIANYIETVMIVVYEVSTLSLFKNEASKYSGNQNFFFLTNILIELNNILIEIISFFK